MPRKNDNVDQPKGGGGESKEEEIATPEHDVTFSVATPEEVFRWDRALSEEVARPVPGKKPAISAWELANVISASAPGAENADEGLILKQGDRIIGAALLAPNHLIGTLVLPEFQKQGYGSRLIEAGIRRLRERGGENILVECCDERAIRAVERLPEDIKSHLNVRDVRRDE